MKEKDLPEIIGRLEKAGEALGISFSDWKYTLETAQGIWDLCPYKAGDRVILVKVPEISETKCWGWLYAKHFMVEGAKATVHSREFYRGQFQLGLHFDDDSYLYNGNVRPVKEKGLFFFPVDSVARLPATKYGVKVGQPTPLNANAPMYNVGMWVEERFNVKVFDTFEQADAHAKELARFNEYWNYHAEEYK